MTATPFVDCAAAFAAVALASVGLAAAGVDPAAVVFAAVFGTLIAWDVALLDGVGVDE